MRHGSGNPVLKVVELLYGKLIRWLFSVSVTGRPGLALFAFAAVAAKLPLSYKYNDFVYSFHNSSVIFLTAVFAAITVLFFRAFYESRSLLNKNLRRFYLSLPIIILLLLIFIFIKANLKTGLAGELSGKYSTVCGSIETLPLQSERPDNRDNGGSFWSSVDFKTDNGMIIRLAGPADKLQYKSKVKITGLFKQPEPETNPGCFSYKNYLLSKGIYLTCSLSGSDKIEILDKPGFWRPQSWAYFIREILGSSLENSLGEKENTLLRSIMLGDDKSLDPKTKIQFRRAGLSHLTAVSGTHVAFMQIPVIALSSLLSISRKKRALLVAAVLLCYGFVTGWKTGVIRAVLMALAVLITRYKNKSSDSLNILGFAGAVIIFLDYHCINQIGFWLSISAAAALTCFSGKLAVWLELSAEKFFTFSDAIKAGPGIYRMLSAVLVIQFVLTPLSSKMSGEVFILSWLINLPSLIIASLICMITAICWPMITGLNIIGNLFDADIFQYASGALQSISAVILNPLLKILMLIAERSSLIRIGRFPAARINIFLWIGIGICVLWFWMNCVVPAFRFKLLSKQNCRNPYLEKLNENNIKKNRIKNRLIIFISSIFICLGSIVLFFTNVSEPDWKIYFLDVGQGDAILIHSKKGKTILIDGGPGGSGYYTILPVMTRLGIDTIDLAILTHGHEDHAGGLAELCELGLIRMVAFNHAAQNYLQLTANNRYVYDNSADMPENKENNPFITRDLTADLIKAALDNSLGMSFLRRGDKVLFDDAQLDVLSPQANMTFEQALKNPNDSSLVISFNWQNHSILLLADLSEDIESEMKGLWNAADVIKVAHHGSRFTTNEEFLLKTRPGLAVISVGNNNYGHPSAELLERVGRFGIPVMRTDVDGCVQVSLDQEGIIASGYNSS